MKRFLPLLAICIFCGFAPSELTQEIKEAGLKIDLPNDQWFLANKIDKTDLDVYMYKRKPIEDQEGRQIIPNIAVFVEDVGTSNKASSTLFLLFMLFMKRKGSRSFVTQQRAYSTGVDRNSSRR